MQSLDELVNRLPAELRQEVLDFVEFLVSRRMGKQDIEFKQDLVGTLKSYREQYTSLTYPTQLVSAVKLDELTGLVSVGGDALHDSESLYDSDSN